MTASAIASDRDVLERRCAMAEQARSEPDLRFRLMEFERRRVVRSLAAW